jgi:hypothetical protein
MGLPRSYEISAHVLDSIASSAAVDADRLLLDIDDVH